jgi:uncharacterized protein with FMN-binding domain
VIGHHDSHDSHDSHDRPYEEHHERERTDMRRIAIAFMSTVSGLVLLFSYHTSTGHGGVTGTVDDTGPRHGPGTPASGAGGPDDAAGGGSETDGTTLTGDSVQTEWGPVQVRITVRNGKIISSEAIAYPNGSHRDVRINSYAVPILNQQAVQAQSADLDGVSGATVTSQGYRQSLQSAIDKAHLG